TDARHCSKDFLLSCTVISDCILRILFRICGKHNVSLEECRVVGCRGIKCSRVRGGLLYPCINYWSYMGSSYLGYMVVLGSDSDIDSGTLVNLCRLSDATYGGI